ncbi:MAG: TonB-dependent receptor [Labilithrix sp.]|nr:TonB-dependent receptor [Labilithrix sp.]MCW5815151.1 TonB-dependent receptor [Labilithrix sp.]
MRRLVFTAIASLLVARSASAQETPPADASNEKELEVRIVGDKADALQKVPGSGTVISQKDLTRQAPVDTAEVLRRVPGVQVRQELSGGNRIDISIRGLESGRSRRVLMLEDGIPIALNPYSEPELNHAPPIERYRSIEVVKGSGNILFGPQTLAGTINFITVAPPDRQRIMADVDYGSYNYMRAIASYGDTLGDVRYVAQVAYRRGDGFRAQPFDSANGLAKILFPTGKDGEAVLKLGFQRDDAASDDIGMPRDMFRADPRRPTLSPSAHSILNRYDASLTHEQRLGERTKLKTLAYGYTTDRDWRRPDWTRNPLPGVQYLRIVGDPTVTGGAVYFGNGNTILSRDYAVMGVEPRFEHRMKTGIASHTIDVGGRLLREDAHYTQRTGAYPQTWAGALDFEQKRKSFAGAAYLQDRIAFREDLLVTPGIRVEHVTSETFTLRQNNVDEYTTGTKPTTGVVPGVGMVYGTKRASVFGNMHYGFAPPRITSSVSARGASRMLQGDRGISYEIGTRGQQFRWLRAEATGFMSNYANQVAVNPSAGGEGNLADVGATNLYGVESGLVLGLDKILKVSTVLDLGARYTYAHASFRYGQFAGNFLPYAPQHSFNTNFDVEHRSGFGGQVAYQFVSHQFADGANTRAEDLFGIVGLIESRHIFDLMAHYRHRPTGLSFRFSLKNVFDTTYVIARRPEGNFPGPYRQALVGVRWEWDGAKRD